MEYALSNLAREVNRRTGWSGPVFHGRYSMIVVTDEEAAQAERLKYVLAQGCKENLVERPRDWPGVGSVRCLLEGEPLSGHWFDRTLEYGGSTPGRDRFAGRLGARVLGPLADSLLGSTCPPRVTGSG